MVENTITVEAADRHSLEILTHEFPAELAYGREGEAIRWISEAAEEVLADSELSQKIHTVLEFGRFATVTGLAMPEHVPPTPYRYLPSSEAIVYDFDIPQIAVSSLIGACYATKHLRGARILADIFPKDQYGTKPDSAFGSNQPFDFHGDGAVHPDTKPEYFSFRAVRNHEQIPTIASWADEKDLSSEAFQRLTEPAFTIHYESANPEAHSVERIAIIENNHTKFLHFNYYGRTKITISNDVESEPYIAALDEFEAALRRNSVPIRLNAGDIMLFDNKAGLHARQSFQPAPEQADRRWMRRVYIAADKYKRQEIEQDSARILRSEVDRGWYL